MGTNDLDPLKLLLEAVVMCDKYVKGCGDSSCHFVRPIGMATNGGCRCLDGRGPKQPGAITALALLLRAAKLLRDAKKPWAETNTGSGLQCTERHAIDGGGLCTLRKGHLGAHAGYGANGSIVTWDGGS